MENRSGMDTYSQLVLLLLLLLLARLSPTCEIHVIYAAAATNGGVGGGSCIIVVEEEEESNLFPLNVALFNFKLLSPLDIATAAAMQSLFFMGHIPSTITIIMSILCAPRKHYFTDRRQYKKQQSCARKGEREQTSCRNCLATFSMNEFKGSL